MRVGVLRYYQVYSLFETEVALRGVALQRRIKTVPRRQYIAFSVSELDEWEWMAV